MKIHEYPMKNQRKSVKIHTHRLIVAIPIDVIDLIRATRGKINR